MSLGQQIKRARKLLGISQQAIADKFGITRAAVAQWELDQTRPDQGRLVSLADILRTDVGTLLEDGKQLTERDPLRTQQQVGSDEMNELRRAWALLLPAERAEILEDVKRRAAHNQAVIDSQTSAVAESRSSTSTGPHERRRGAVWYGFPDRRQKGAINEK